MPQRRNIPDDNEIKIGRSIISSDEDSVFDIILDLESGRVSTTDDGADENAGSTAGTVDVIGETAGAEGPSDKDIPVADVPGDETDVSAGDVPEISSSESGSPESGIPENDIPEGGIPEDDIQVTDVPDGTDGESPAGEVVLEGDVLPEVEDDDGSLFEDELEGDVIEKSKDPDPKAASAETESGSGVLAALAGGDDVPDYGGMYIIGGNDDVAEERDNADSHTGDTAKTAEELKTEEDSRMLKALIDAADGNETGADTVDASKLNVLATEMEETREDPGSVSKLRNILGLSMPDSNGGKTIGGITHGMWAIIILLVFVVDVILLNFVISKLIYPAVSSVMKETGAASLKLATYETLYTGISYGVAFLIGGLVVFLIAKIAQILMEEVGAENPGTVIKATLLAAIAFFTIGGIIAMLATRKGLFTVTVYYWIAPMAAYAGGLIFFAVSGIGRKRRNG